MFWLGAGGGRFVQQGEPRIVDAQSTVQIRGAMLLVIVKDPSSPVAPFLLLD